MESFTGSTYLTSSWPRDEVDFTGQRVAVIGTGSSGIQAIPELAAHAASLTVFQRTPAFSIPAHHGPPTAAKLAYLQDNRDAYLQEKRSSIDGIQTMTPRAVVGALSVSDQERTDAFEEAWKVGGLGFSFTFPDLLVDPGANEAAADFIRSKIRATVKDPAVAETLCPTSFPYGTKRPCLDNGYYETFNLDHVHLVDLQKTPIERITSSGIRTQDGADHTFDAIVLATGFDAMTGALVSVDITGRNGITLAEKWKAGPQTYLGLMTEGFPNFFTVTGPGSPSVLSNMVVSIEQHVDWICDAIAHADTQLPTFDTMEPTSTAETGWGNHVNLVANFTLFPQAESWYMGANVPGKPRVFLPYIGGCAGYRAICVEVIDKDWLGFEFRGKAGSKVNDGVVR
jgi:cation diffusion facilitator CzcD-associated flavoprotein CzcO